MTNLISDPKTLLYAIVGGALPAVFWLWFWLRQEDDEQKEPKILIAATFILGAVTVIVAIGLEKYSLNFIKSNMMILYLNIIILFHFIFV